MQACMQPVNPAKILIPVCFGKQIPVCEEFW